ncbi:MAG: tripartite tricarboxylate transporter substrate-binding protein [Alphaproteobacteria bacterium]|nr:tripartite tricarboxylate transporter substrate-binding protein [Alphaproteobacteria bacterium]
MKIPSKKTGTGILIAAIVGVAGLAADAGGAAAAGVEEFYKGRQLKMIIRSSPGGGYDTYARLLAQHIGRHIPGGPRMIAINMPGGGGIRAANYVANIAPKDGSILTIMSRGLPMYQAMGGKKFKGDVRKFNWICDLSDSNPLLVTWHGSPTKTIQDAMKRETILGATGAGSISVQIPVAYNRLLGTKLKIIFGYKGGSSVNLAIERGEVEGRATNNLASWKSTHPLWIKEKKLNLLMQLGLKKDKELPDVPLLKDLVKGDPEKEKVAHFLSLAYAVGRPIATGSGVPAERVAALRKACGATMTDAKFLEEAKGQRAEIGYLPGEEVQKIITEIVDAPKSLIETVKVYMKPRGREADKRKEKLVKVSATVTAVKRKGRAIELKDKSGKTVTTKVHSKRSKIMIGGKKAKRSKIATGMACDLTYEGPGSEAKEITCR